MVDSSHEPASFLTQANALLRKNLTFQKRNLRTNIGLVAFPLLLCFLLINIQTLVNHELNKAKYRCGCTCIDRNRSGTCETVCGIEYSTLDQVATFSIPNPAEWPALLQVPGPAYRAVRTTDLIPFTDLPNKSCWRSTTGSSCSAIILITGGEMCARYKSMAQYFFTVNNELFKGYRQGNPDRKINEILTAYDFLNTNEKIFNVSGITQPTRTPLERVSNAYLQFLKGDAFKILLGFVKEMPKAETKRRLDFSLLLGALFFTWVVLQLFPVILTSLVYEKQQNLRIMMKMPGLGDGPYWMISYGYFLVLSSVYMLSFAAFGTVIGLKFFTLNDYSIQFVFFLIYVNLQIALSFLAATLFSDVKTATGLLGAYLLQPFVEDTSFPRGWIIVMELYPGFSLYRGLYEFTQYSFRGNLTGTDGMQWKDLSDGINGVREVLIIMFVEWVLVLPVAYYLDQVVSFGGSYVFTMTISSHKEMEVEKLVFELSPGAKKLYHISGTQKLELPKQEVRIAYVFQAVEKAKNEFTIFAWGLTDTTLEDVLVKVARGSQAFNTFS